MRRGQPPSLQNVRDALVELEVIAEFDKMRNREDWTTVKRLAGESYRRLALERHPDRTGGDSEPMSRLNAAWDLIKGLRMRSMKRHRAPFIPPWMFAGGAPAWCDEFKQYSEREMADLDETMSRFDDLFGGRVSTSTTSPTGGFGGPVINIHVRRPKR